MTDYKAKARDIAKKTVFSPADYDMVTDIVAAALSSVAEAATAELRAKVEALEKAIPNWVSLKPTALERLNDLAIYAAEKIDRQEAADRRVEELKAELAKYRAPVTSEEEREALEWFREPGPFEADRHGGVLARLLCQRTKERDEALNAQDRAEACAHEDRIVKDQAEAALAEETAAREDAEAEAGSLREMFVRPQHANKEIEEMLGHAGRRADRAEKKAVELAKELRAAEARATKAEDELSRAKEFGVGCRHHTLGATIRLLRSSLDEVKRERDGNRMEWSAAKGSAISYRLRAEKAEAALSEKSKLLELAREALEKSQAFAKSVFDAFIYQSTEQLPKRPAQVGGPLSMASYEEAEESRQAIARWEYDRQDAEKRIDPLIKTSREIHKSCRDTLAQLPVTPAPEKPAPSVEEKKR